MDQARERRPQAKDVNERGVIQNPGNDHTTAAKLRKSLLDEDALTSKRLVELEPLLL